MIVKIRRVVIVIISVDFLSISSLLDDLTFYKDFSLKSPNGFAHCYVRLLEGALSEGEWKSVRV